ncbi:MAG TPA: hypothetical protein VJ986_02545 [Gaiellaceae bacterium]|nr:hypothetical protein [Gaiellaceae bacterium]
MKEVRHPGEGRGIPLLLAHCASLDSDASQARERLDEALGPELARKLVFALTIGTGAGQRRVA